jgi:DNA polymerase I-like protein with 3'-5' exonuclease and polymerase domains
MMQFPDLSKFPEFAYDTETTGLNPMAGARVFGFSISTPDGKDYYWDIRETPAAVHWINSQVRDYTGTIVCHNLSFDYRMSHATGIHLPIERCVDTVIQACLINEHEFSYSLDALCKKYTNARKSGDELYGAMAKIFGGRATRNVQMKRISEAPIYLVAPYDMDDTRGTLELYYHQLGEIKRQRLEKIIAFEREVTPVLIAAEMHGVRVDVPAAERAVVGLSEEIKAMQKKLDEIAGFACNPQPSGQIKKLFDPKWRDGRWWANDGTPLQETNAGQASLDADALRVMTHPAASTILQLRSLIKTRDTFLVGHVLESSVNGRVYPSVNQTKGEDGGTGTGRLSYSGPALQQIPDRNKVVAEIVKRVFLPDEGHVWVDADMASFEVRIFAHLVGTQDICQAYVDNPEIDFHQFVADMTGLVRNATYNGQPNAKQLNLSMIFNQGNGTTAEEMGMPWDWESFMPSDSKDGKEVVYKKAGPEAMAVIEKYHNRLPGVKKLANGCKMTAEQRQWLFTRYGRHLRFPRGYKSYKASGILIQSTSADENKLNWLRINEALKGTDAKMLLNTHDSYSMSMPEEESLSIARKVKEAIEKDRGLRVPLILEVQGAGKNWWESKSSKRWM